MAQLEFVDWVDRVFAGPVPEDFELWDDALDAPALWPLQYATRLFRSPTVLLARYDDNQLERGFWHIPHEWQLWERLWDTSIPIGVRRECVESMVPLFREFFTYNPLDDACFMWWDMLRRFGESPDIEITQAMFTALCQVLVLPAPHCVRAALHGLGHLEHPNKEQTIRRFLEQHPDLDDEVKQYALDAIIGKVL